MWLEPSVPVKLEPRRSGQVAQMSAMAQSKVAKLFRLILLHDSLTCNAVIELLSVLLFLELSISLTLFFHGEGDDVPSQTNILVIALKVSWEMWPSAALQKR